MNVHHQGQVSEIVTPTFRIGRQVRQGSQPLDVAFEQQEVCIREELVENFGSKGHITESPWPGPTGSMTRGLREPSRALTPGADTHLANGNMMFRNPLVRKVSTVRDHDGLLAAFRDGLVSPPRAPRKRARARAMAREPRGVRRGQRAGSPTPSDPTVTACPAHSQGGTPGPSAPGFSRVQHKTAS
jgi:hypothetical protein